MTLLEIRNQIVAHFIDCDTFVIPTDLKKVLVSKPQEHIKLELVKLAMSELKESNFCQAILGVDGDKAIYVLSNPIFSEGQNVKISMITANAVAEIVNAYSGELEDGSIMTNKMSIQDKDIQFLCIVINNLLQNQSLSDGSPEGDE